MKPSNTPDSKPPYAKPRPRGGKEKMKSPLPMKQGVSASRVWLPKIVQDKNGANKSHKWKTVLDFLMDEFPFISEEIFKERISLGEIVSDSGELITPNTAYQEGIHVFYYREVPNEKPLPFEEKILFKDEHIIVVDKPHFIPVTPIGRCVKESLLSRLKHRFQNEEISPIHRLDRETAGVMLYSCNAKIRGAYQYLFEKRLVKKSYEAIAPIAPAEREFPYTHRSHVVSSNDPFFIMCEDQNAAPNTETIMNIIETKGSLARYKLEPITGKQHQLRVHLMSIGCPIVNDPFYPKLMPSKGEDYSNPLQLLAKTIQFTDPFTQKERFFESKMELTF